MSADEHLARAAVAAAASRGWITVEKAWDLALTFSRGRVQSIAEMFAGVLSEDQIDELSVLLPPTESGETPGVVSASARQIVTMPGPPPVAAAVAIQAHSADQGEVRYTFLQDLGVGGIGKVVHATDRVIGRDVALKTLRDGMGMAPDVIERFLAEASVTARLEHPNVVPVHDIGQFPNGQPYYTMRVVKQRSLQDVLASAELRGEWPLVRLVGAFVQISRALAYAHRRGVWHRDIKPENILLGDFGEVYLADWGNAKMLPGSAIANANAKRSTAPSIPPGEIDEELRSRPPEHSGLSGTPGYIAPEQIRGDRPRIDHRADLFALGVVLYEILTGQHPFDAPTVLGVILATQTRVPKSPRTLLPTCPLILEDLCLAMLSKDPDGRPESAERVAAEAEAFLEGARERERRHEEALRLCELAQLPVERSRALGQERARLLAEARHLLANVKGYEPVENKRPAWELEDRAAQVERDEAVAAAEAIDLFTKALAYDPLSIEARSSLSELYWARAREAEADRRPALRVYYEALVSEFDVGRYATLLRADATISIDSDPPGAVVTAYLYEQHDRVLVPAEQRILGRTPVVEARLPPGSYLIVLRRAGYRDVSYPVVLKRGEEHDARVSLYTDAEIGEDFVYVPGGPFVCGGDPVAPAALSRCEPDVPDFAIARFPVTMRQYCAFLDALDRVDPALAERRAPQDKRGSEGFVVRRGADGRWEPRDVIIEGEARRMFPIDEGHLWKVPVLLIDWFDAVAYCRWRSEQDGHQLRLPTELEWEKAARGVDGRAHPWGDHFDPTFCLMQASRHHVPQAEPVGTFPTDRSPYGVHDMAGSMREWMGDIHGERTWAELCAEPEPGSSTERGDSSERIIRSGNWVATGEYCRSAARSRFFALTRGTGLSFRVAKSLTRSRKPRG
ncbi:Putative serine/threonine-protein kinase pknH [Minicystis rosea]|nr:Putative serine/threonine-protein kinase pknH [Minicystis rosea]